MSYGEKNDTSTDKRDESSHIFCAKQDVVFFEGMLHFKGHQL